MNVCVLIMFLGGGGGNRPSDFIIGADSETQYKVK